jgi:hypothetical protein
VVSFADEYLICDNMFETVMDFLFSKTSDFAGLIND